MSKFIIDRSDPAYPESLKSDGESTAVLYGVGNRSALTPGVAIIGARDATPYGLRASELVAEWAVSAGMTVYSGAARGCDQAAHRAALAAGGRTIAVLGCGPDVVYPANARDLLASMKVDGAVISPFNWTTPPARFRFPIRNRVIAALASLVVVTEARLPSGTFSTVQHAADLGTTVAAVPGSIFSRYADAPNRLIADGAQVITRCEDLLTALNMLFLKSADGSVLPGPAIAVGPAAGGTLERRIIRALAAQPLGVVGLAASLGADSSTVARTVERMAVNGRVTRFPDGTYMAFR